MWISIQQADESKIVKNFQRFVSSTCLSRVTVPISVSGELFKVNVVNLCKESLLFGSVRSNRTATSVLTRGLQLFRSADSSTSFFPFFTSGRASMLGKSLFVLCTFFLVLFYTFFFWWAQHSAPEKWKELREYISASFRPKQTRYARLIRLRLYLHGKEINSLCEVWVWRETIRWAEDGEQTSPVL